MSGKEAKDSEVDAAADDSATFGHASDASQKSGAMGAGGGDARPGGRADHGVAFDFEDLGEALADDSPAADHDAHVRELQASVADLEDKLMRAAADVQNARKRAERDRRDAEAYGGAKLARDLLPVFDNLDAALKLATDELREREPGFFNGVELTRKELVNAFAKHKISLVEPAIGDRFDPNHHQAMFEAPTPGAEPGSIIQVMQAGFMISERLLRPAMVGVARAGEDGPSSDKQDITEADDE